MILDRGLFCNHVRMLSEILSVQQTRAAEAARRLTRDKMSLCACGWGGLSCPKQSGSPKGPQQHKRAKYKPESVVLKTRKQQIRH